MSRRKDELRALLSGGGGRPEETGPAPEAKSIASPPGEPAAPAGALETGAPVPRATSGAVKAMGLALGSLRAGADEARALRETLQKGDRVVEIDPALIEPAFVADRLSRAEEGDESFAALQASIAESGQTVPVLVRPHPDAAKAEAGRFQAAYGHRRIAAAKALGIKVRAVVRALSDEELVLAQGKENSERRDLSFIERALFADALLKRGFERRTVQAALSLHKAEMTRLLQVAEAVPEGIARAIGPAPKAGRLRWMELAAHLKDDKRRADARHEATLQRFRHAGSDERFALILKRVGPTKAKTEPQAVLDAEGAALAEIRRGAKATILEIRSADFADYLATELPALHAAFLAARSGEPESGG